MNQAAIDFSAARSARDCGISASVMHADRVVDGWADMAFDALCRYARTVGQFTSYDFRKAGLIESPTTDKAFGGVFQRAARAGVIRKVGFTQHPERHCSPTPVWECGSNAKVSGAGTASAGLPS